MDYPNAGQLSLRNFGASWGSVCLSGQSSNWLLIGGSYGAKDDDTPKKIGQCGRRGTYNRAGGYLKGCKSDISSVENFLNANKVGSTTQRKSDQQHSFWGKLFKDGKADRTDVIKKIKELLRHCKNKKTIPVIYYTGHGRDTGEWCFSSKRFGDDQYFGFKDLQAIFGVCVSSGKADDKFPIVISDSCYSGVWAKEARQFPGQYVYSACAVDELAYDSENGGYFTQRILLGKKVEGVDFSDNQHMISSDGRWATTPRRSHLEIYKHSYNYIYYHDD